MAKVVITVEDSDIQKELVNVSLDFIPALEKGQKRTPAQAIGITLAKDMADPSDEGEAEED